MFFFGGGSSFCWVGVVWENCTLRILRLAERTNLFWTSSYYLMLLQCFWIPDFYLSATHMSWLSFQGSMVFLFPMFFSEGLPPTTPHQKKKEIVGDFLVHSTCSFGCFQKYEKTPKSSILIGFSIINHPFWGFYNPYFGKHPFDSPSSSCYHHHRCHLPKWRLFHPVESLQKHETMLWPQQRQKGICCRILDGKFFIWVNRNYISSTKISMK